LRLFGALDRIFCSILLLGSVNCYDFVSDSQFLPEGIDSPSDKAASVGVLAARMDAIESKVVLLLARRTFEAHFETREFEPNIHRV
jgi:hypothetical protein